MDTYFKMTAKANVSLSFFFIVYLTGTMPNTYIVPDLAASSFSSAVSNGLVCVYVWFTCQVRQLLRPPTLSLLIHNN